MYTIKHSFCGYSLVEYKQFLNNSISRIDGTLTYIITLDESGYGSNDKDWSKHDID